MVSVRSYPEANSWTQEDLDLSVWCNIFTMAGMYNTLREGQRGQLMTTQAFGFHKVEVIAFRYILNILNLLPCPHKASWVK